MGRGRAKAKQAKVARALKYHSPNTDLAALERELGGRAEDVDDELVDDTDTDADDSADGTTDDGRWAARRR